MPCVIKAIGSGVMASCFTVTPNPEVNRTMLKSCKYCGRIHDSKFVCPQKPKAGRHRSDSKAAAFRRTYIWQKKSKEIIRRDFHMCRICNEGSYGVFGIPGLVKLLHVHHIEPLVECFERRLDDDNLLTCCSTHHELAEAGKIPREYMHELATSPPRWG